MDKSDHSEGGFKPIGGFLNGELSKRNGVCEMHGPYVETVMKRGGRDHGSGCEKCMLERYAAETHQRLETNRLKAKQDRLEAIMKRVGVPKKYQHAEFDNFELSQEVRVAKAQRSAVDACRAYADNFDEAIELGKNLLLLGKVGTGKSHLAWSIAKTVARSGWTAISIRAGDIVQRIREAGILRISVDEIYRELVDADLLIIEETEGFHGEGAREILINLIDRRYENNRPIVALTNLNLDELTEKIAESSVDRLAHNSTKVPFTWASYRRTPPNNPSGNVTPMRRSGM